MIDILNLTGKIFFTLFFFKIATLAWILFKPKEPHLRNYSPIQKLLFFLPFEKFRKVARKDSVELRKHFIALDLLFYIILVMGLIVLVNSGIAFFLI